MARTGRRPGQTQTRDAILAAARRQFGERGYDGATIRGIAAEAGVNAALVHHFFGSKDQVFIAALDLPVDPTVIVRTILDGPREQIGERMIRLFLRLWGEPPSRDSFFALVRSVTSNPKFAGLLRQFLEREVVGKIAPALGVPAVRITAAAAQGMGLALVRYVIQLEPMVAADDEELIELVAPVLQYYIAGAPLE